MKDALRRAVAASGLSQNAIAERAGMHRTNLNKMVNGKLPVTEDAARRLSPVLGVPWWELAYYTDQAERVLRKLSALPEAEVAQIEQMIDGRLAVAELRRSPPRRPEDPQD